MIEQTGRRVGESETGVYLSKSIGAYKYIFRASGPIREKLNAGDGSPALAETSKVVLFDRRFSG
jgi:hypothetical protein